MAFDVQTYTDLSDQIQTKKTEIVDALSELHTDLCALVQLERSLENERVKGVITTGVLMPKNSAELAGPLDAYLNQIQVPAVHVWGQIDGAIATIYAHTQNARAQLPALYARIDRANDLTGNQG